MCKATSTIASSVLLIGVATLLSMGPAYSLAPLCATEMDQVDAGATFEDQQCAFCYYPGPNENPITGECVMIDVPEGVCAGQCLRKIFGCCFNTNLGKCEGVSGHYWQCDGEYPGWWCRESATECDDNYQHCCLWQSLGTRHGELCGDEGGGESDCTSMGGFVCDLRDCDAEPW